MDEPVTRTSSGASSARRRSSRASASGSTFDLAGIPVRHEADSPEGVALLRGLLGGSAVTTPFEARLRHRLEPLELPTSPPHQRYAQLDVWYDDGRVTVRHEQGLATGFASAEEAVLAGPPDDRLFRGVLQLLLTHLLAGKDRFLLHGAAVRPPGGGAALVLGATGRGKSTVALAALDAGWPVLSDDLVALHLTPAGIVARGIAKPLALPPDVGTASPRPGAEPMSDERGRSRLGADVLDERPALLEQLVIVDHGSAADSCAEPLHVADAMRAVAASFVSLSHRPTLERFRPTMAATARLPAWRLRHGRDAAHRLAGARWLLERGGDQ